MPSKGDPAAFLCARLRPGDVVIDVGANRGKVTLELAKAVGPTGHVIAIEPDPRCREFLDACHTRYFHVDVRQVAAGAARTRTALYQANTAEQSSLHQTAVNEHDRAGAVSVECVPLDNLVSQAAGVKVDVQGGEADVLRGARALLRSCPLWVLELWPWGLRQAGERPDAAVTPFVEAGLVPRYLSADDPIPQPQDFIDYCESVTAPNEHINVAWVRV